MLRFMARSSPFTVSMPGPLISDGTAITAIRTPPGVIGSNLRSPCRGTPWLCGSPLRFLTATRQEVQYHRKSNACWPARKDCCGLRGGRKPHPDFRVAGREEHTSEL